MVLKLQDTETKPLNPVIFMYIVRLEVLTGIIINTGVTPTDGLMSVINRCVFDLLVAFGVVVLLLMNFVLIKGIWSGLLAFVITLVLWLRGFVFFRRRT